MQKEQILSVKMDASLTDLTQLKIEMDAYDGDISIRQGYVRKFCSILHRHTKGYYHHVLIDGRKKGTNGATTLRRTHGVTSLMDLTSSPQKYCTKRSRELPKTLMDKLCQELLKCMRQTYQ